MCCLPLCGTAQAAATTPPPAPPKAPTLHSRSPHSHSELTMSLTQVIGNKWDTYLDLLQAGYSEQ